MSRAWLQPTVTADQIDQFITAYLQGTIVIDGFDCLTTGMRFWMPVQALLDFSRRFSTSHFQRTLIVR